MSVNTRKIRQHVLEYARHAGMEHMLNETMGVRGRELVELLEVYDAAIHMEALALSFARVILVHQMATDETRKLAEGVVAAAKLRARSTKR